MPSLLQSLSLISVSHLTRTLDVDISKQPVGVYSETENRSILAKQLESSPPWRSAPSQQVCSSRWKEKAPALCSRWSH